MISFTLRQLELTKRQTLVRTT